MSIEERAHVEYEAWKALGLNAVDGSGAPMQELVALGFETSAEEVVWYMLNNSAEVNPDGRGEFFVEASEIMRVFDAAIAELGQEASLMPRMLWHTHTGTVGPSSEDVAEFPSWLADVGIIYHLPTRSSTPYNSAGIIQLGSSDLEPLATSEETG